MIRSEADVQFANGHGDALCGISLKKCFHARDVLGRDGKRCLPPIGADDAFFGVEALDEQFEGVLLQDCMMI